MKSSCANTETKLLHMISLFNNPAHKADGLVGSLPKKDNFF